MRENDYRHGNSPEMDVEDDDSDDDGECDEDHGE